jgi:hypothetical protein
MLGETTRLILSLLSDGKRYDDVLAEFPHLTLFDLLNSAAEVSDFLNAFPGQAKARAVFRALAEGYGFEAVEARLGVTLFNVQQAAWQALDMDRVPRRRRKPAAKRPRRKRGKRTSRSS